METILISNIIFPSDLTISIYHHDDKERERERCMSDEDHRCHHLHPCVTKMEM